MSSKIFDALLEEKIDLFINSFQTTSRSVFFDEQTKRLRHSGEFGMYREKISHSFLKFIIPQKFSIGDGFIISNKDEVSTQCDIIIYDRSITPLIQSNEQQTFYPIETVVAVGEIKSVMSKREFTIAIKKLSEIKKIKTGITTQSLYSRREKLGPYDPKNIHYDSLFTFIICEKLNFNLDNIESELDTIYSASTDFWNRHNLILSIEDGLFQYAINQETGKVSFWAPTFHGETSHQFIKKIENQKYNHFKKFALGLFNGISFATVLYPDLVHYINGIIPVDTIE